MAGIGKRATKPLQIAFRTARLGESASNKADFHAMRQAVLFADRGKPRAQATWIPPNSKGSAREHMTFSSEGWPGREVCVHRLLA